MTRLSNNNDYYSCLYDDEFDRFLTWSDLIAPEEVESEEELLVFVKKLQIIAPHIRWRARPEVYDIVVPDEQHNEAEFILELWKRGENLDGYCTEWMYPDLYLSVDGKMVLKPEIATFIDLARQFIKLVSNAARYDLRELLGRFAVLLPQLYAAAWNLPDIPYNNIFPSPYIDPRKFHRGVTRPCQLEDDIESYIYPKAKSYLEGLKRFEIYYAVDEPYSSERVTVVECNLLNDLLEIYKMLDLGLEFFDGKDFERMSDAVAYWRDKFDWTVGWGYKVLRILTALHQALETLYREQVECKNEEE